MTPEENNRINDLETRLEKASALAISLVSVDLALAERFFELENYIMGILQIIANSPLITDEKFRQEIKSSISRVQFSDDQLAAGLAKIKASLTVFPPGEAPPPAT